MKKEHNTKWLQIGQTLDIGLVFSMMEYEHFCLLRTADSIFLIDLDNNSIIWKVELLPDISFFGQKCIEMVDDKVIAFEKSGYDSATLISLDFKTGEILWKSEIKGYVKPLGLTLLNNFIWIHIELSNDKNYLAQIDPNTGKTIQKIEILSANEIKTISNRLYIFSKSGLYVYKDSYTTPRQLTSHFPNFPAFSENYIYFFYESDHAIKIVHWDASSESILNEMEYIFKNNKIEKIINTEDPNIIAVMHNLGFYILDIKEKKQLGSVSLEEGCQAISISKVLNKIAFIYTTPSGNPINIIYNSLTGEMEEDFETEDLYPFYIWQIENKLIISGLGGLNIYMNNPSISNKADKGDRSQETKNATHVIKSDEVVPLDANSMDSSKTEQNEKRQHLINLFIRCMQEEVNSENFISKAKQFNKLLDNYLEQYKTESVGTIAFGISQLGLPYNDVFSDIVFVRSIGND